jgi:hypothetical protein
MGSASTIERNVVDSKAMEKSGDQRVDVNDVTLVWGNASRWKATLRGESERRHLALPIAERLRRALELVQRAPHGRDRART